MVSLVIDIFLLALLVLIAVMVVRTGRLYAVIVMSGAYSLTSAAIFVNLDAVDVAFTEAAVGAGISTVLFLAAMAYIPADEKPSQNRNFLAGVICIVAGALLLLAVMDLPSLGDAMAPVHQHVAPRYLAESGSALHIPNVVTTVLASYRGFDTLGETIVVFTAGLGVLMLLAGATRTNRVKADNRKTAAKTAKPKTNKPQTAKPKSATMTARTKA
jgi:multicomponent Na+:H+ antiporter subunit B